MVSKVDMNNIDLRNELSNVPVAAGSEAPSDKDIPDNPENVLKLDIPKSGEPITRDDKLDILTVKMDKVLDYLAYQKEKSDASEVLTAAESKILEKSHNSVVDKMQHIDLDLAACNAKIAQNIINIETNESCIASIETQMRLMKVASNECEMQLKALQGKFSQIQKDVSGNKYTVLDLG